MLEANWPEIEADLADRGINVWDPSTLALPWPWLRSRILALLSVPPTWAPDGTAVPATRLGRVQWTPPAKWSTNT